jgi:hypothetical protein
MWFPASLSFRVRRHRSENSPISRTKYRPRLEALEDRLMLWGGGSGIDPALLYSATTSSPGWSVAVDGSGSAYVAADGGTVGKLDPTGTTYQSLATFGGRGIAIALDTSGNIYVAGAGATITPTANAFSSAPSTLFMAKMDPTGNVLYSTYIPGSNYGNLGQPIGIAVDGAGNVYVTGAATSAFITTPNAYQPAYTGAGNNEAFLAEFNPALSGAASLVYGSFLGGTTGWTQANCIALDGAGNAYITGTTVASDLPTTAGAFQTAIKGTEDTFVAKFNTSLTGSASLVYSTFLGGSGAFDGVSAGYGNPWHLGVPYYPGPAVAVDSSGCAYVTGETNSSDFPTTPGAGDRTYISTNPWGGDVYVTKFNSSGSGLIYSTFLGGSDVDTGTSIAVDSSGNATVVGGTRSTDFPTQTSIQPTSPGTPSNFVTTLNSSGSALLFSTYIGSAGVIVRDVAEDAAGSIYVTGGPNVVNPGYLYKISSPVGPSFSVTGFPSSVTAGTSGTITVTALNADGSANTGYSGAVHFTSSDPQAVLPADATLTNGTGTFNVILKTAGTRSITARDSSNEAMAGAQFGITVNPAAATHFVIAGPSSVAASTAFNVTVTAMDAYGNVATGYRGTVHFSDPVGGSTLPSNYTFKASDNGMHTFTGLKLRTKGLQTITVTDTVNSSITGSLNITVT